MNSRLAFLKWFSALFLHGFSVHPWRCDSRAHSACRANRPKKIGVFVTLVGRLARTSTDMIDRFYGSHVLSALDKGTEIVDSVHAKQERYAAKKAEKVGKG